MAVQQRHTRRAMGRITRVLIAAWWVAACAGGSVSNAASQTGGAREPTVWTAMNRGGEVMLLQCRGGPGFEFKSLGYKVFSGGATRIAVAMTFSPSAGVAGANNQNLQPGSCAPTDVPLTSSDPRELHFLTDAFVQLLPGPIDISPTAAESHPDIRSMIDYLKDPGHYWTFHAMNMHAGYFDVSIHEYWTNRATPPGPAIDSSPPLAIARWLLRVMISGGIAGSKREVSVNGDGRIQASGSGSFGGVHCSATISRSDSQHLEAALARAHPESWPKAYPMKGNGCCDQLEFSMHLDQEDARGQRASRETSWMSENAATVPEEVSALFKLIFEARHACVF
jgi:hypothetical protein